MIVISNNFDETREILNEIPLSGIRRMIADKMEESLQKAPQATMSTKADMSALIDLKVQYSKQGISLNYTDLFVKVTESALRSNPALNACLQNGKIVQYKSVNIGVAVGTDHALFVPVIKNVQKKSLLEVSESLKESIQKIHDQRITSEDFSDGTFTLSNMGMFDVDIMTPIINYPEVAILSIGKTRKELVVNDDNTIMIKPTATLSLTLNHAALDGLPAVRFLETFLKIMKNPLDYFS